MSAVFVSICLVLLFCASIPIKIALLVRIRQGLRFGAGLAPFSDRLALKIAQRNVLAEKRKWKLPRGIRRGAAISAARTTLRAMLKKLRPVRFRARGRICTADAAATALICGGTQAVQGALAPLLPPDRVLFSLRPDFGAGHSDADFCGIVSIRAGHIMLAALKGAWNYFIQTRRQKHGKTSD